MPLTVGGLSEWVDKREWQRHIIVPVQKHPHLFRGSFVVYSRMMGIFGSFLIPSKSWLLYHFFDLPICLRLSCPGNLRLFFNLRKMRGAPRDHPMENVRFPSLDGNLHFATHEKNGNGRYYFMFVLSFLSMKTRVRLSLADGIHQAKINSTARGHYQTYHAWSWLTL